LALEAGNAWGGWNLATNYFDGDGVQKDYAEAARLFARAVVCERNSDAVCKKIVNDDNKYFYYIKGRWRDASFNKRLLSEFHEYYPDAAFALDYALLKQNPNLERPFEHFIKHKTPAAVNVLKTFADKGNRWAQFKIADLQWSGEAPDALPQDRDAAIAFWEKNSNDKEARKKLVSASAEGIYRKPIPQKWFDEDHNLSSLMKNNDALKKGVENGSRTSAEALDKATLCYEGDANKLFLLEHAAKTGYDKYAEDAKRINNLYQRVVNFTNAGKEETFTREYVDTHFPAVFVDFYTKHPKYDKQGLLKKAQLVKDFIQVNYTLYGMTEEPYGNGVRTSFFGLIKKAQWESGAINYWFGEVNSAIATCNKYASGTTLNSAFKKSLPKLKEKLANGVVSLNRQRREYEREVAEENRRSAEVDEMRDIERGRRAYPKPKVISSSDESETIEFADGTRGTLFLDKEGWYVDPGMLSSNKHYKTYGQAVKALYLYKKYSHISDDGLKR
jgi:TPR repeat protein